MTADAVVEARPPLWWILARHEWRLTIRGIGGKARVGAKVRKTIGTKRRIAGYVGLAVLLHLFGGVSLLLPRRWADTQATRIAVIALLAFLFTMMLSSAMSRIVAAFHERRDLDLLLGAPVPAALILVVRATTVVVTVALLFALFVYPVADVGVASGRWWMARLYPLVPVMAVASTAVALLVTGAVVRLIGVRRARVGLQIFSALVGASFYLVSQARQFLPPAASDAVMTWLRDATRDDAQGLPVHVAARLAAGDAVVWFIVVIVAFGLFAVAVRSARRRFVEVAMTPEADAPTVAPARASVDARIGRGFSSGPFATLLRKEWRLIVRAPQLVSQILLQLLYLMPLMFVAFGRRGVPTTWTGSAFAAGIVGIASTLATSLAWLTVSAEDAPDLIGGSPKRRVVILGAKLVAAASPPVVLLAIAAIGTARRSMREAVLVIVFGVLACGAAAVLAAASPSSGRCGDFQRRHQGRGPMAIVEALQFLLWAAATGTAAAGLWLVSLGLTALALLMPALSVKRALRRFDDMID